MLKSLQNLKLYNFSNSSASWRVRIVLGWKDIKYEYISIPLTKDGGHQHKSDYAKINPMEQIPTLEVDGKHITESLPICLFLEEMVPQRPLLPNDPIQKAQILSFCEMINSGIHPKIIVDVQEQVERLGQDKKEWVGYWSNKGYKKLEKYLENTRGKYCFGDEITLADVFFLPMTEAGIQKFGLEIDNFPIAKSLLETLRNVPEFERAYPQKQPDAE